MIDTNVFMSALISANSVCHKVLHLTTENHELILCDYIIDECYDVANRKFPTRIKILDEIFAKLRYDLIPAPRVIIVEMADIKDQPILNAAIQYNIDILVSGDKHFLSLQIEIPEILSPAEFLEMHDH